MEHFLHRTNESVARFGHKWDFFLLVLVTSELLKCFVRETTMYKSNSKVKFPA